ncbi:MAG: hypothetical protein ACREMU_02365 [Gemmatimonadaceae bacterium]
MSIEPHARRRLQLVYVTSRDPEVVKDLRHVLEDDQMSFVPSAELLRDIALCAACTQDAPRTGRAGLCDDHRTRWNFEACSVEASDTGDELSLDRLVTGVLASPDGGAQFLTAFERQRRALRLVLEAHARGAVQLPDSVAATVERACSSGPRFLNGGTRSAVQQAS